MLLYHSHEQARSLGSALEYMSGELRVVDVYTVSFAEEASAVFGDVVWDQIHYLNDVITTVRSLYDREFCKFCIVCHIGL